MNPFQTSDEQALQALEREFFTAVKRRDQATVERIAAPDFEATGFNGRRVDVAGYVRVHFAPEHEFTQFDTHDVQTRVYGDAAVRTGLIDVEDVKSWRGVDHYRFTATWARQAGAWRLVAYQETTLAPDPAAQLVDVFNVFTLRPGQESQQQALLDLVQKGARGTASQNPGFVSSQVYRSVDGKAVVNHSQWTGGPQQLAANHAHNEANPDYQAQMTEIGQLAEMQPVACVAPEPK